MAPVTGLMFLPGPGIRVDVTSRTTRTAVEP